MVEAAKESTHLCRTTCQGGAFDRIIIL